jgi:hypothetical protein
MALKVQTLFIDDLDGSIGDPCTAAAGKHFPVGVDPGRNSARAYPSGHGRPRGAGREPSGDAAGGQARWLARPRCPRGRRTGVRCDADRA